MTADRREGVRLFAVSAVWIGSAYALAQHAAPWLPRALAAQLTLPSFLCLVLVTSTALALALAAKIVPRPAQALGASAPSGAAAATALFAAPVVSATSMYLGFTIALPTLIAEIQAGGRQAAQANTGELGRAVVETHVATTLLWALLVTPIVEELMFRGALWGAVERFTRGAAARASLPPELLDRSGLDAVVGWLRRGGAPTLATTAVFTWLHADQPGGAGIVRMVQTAVLGLVLGGLRHGSGGVAAGMVLHAAFNLLALAKSRQWIAGVGWPAPLPIPLLYWQLAAVGAALLLLVVIHQSARLRRVTLAAEIHVAAPRAEVFAFVVDPASIAHGFHGHGPIPRALRAEIVGGGGVRVGAVRRVHNADGSAVDEVIRALEPPSLQAYELTAGFRPPFSWLVTGAHGSWHLDDEGDGTRVAWSFAWRLRSGLWWPIARLVGRSFAAAMRACLLRHRSHLESTARGEDASEGAATAHSSGHSGS